MESGGGGWWLLVTLQGGDGSMDMDMDFTDIIPPSTVYVYVFFSILRRTHHGMV
jgi:hypothetical protein